MILNMMQRSAVTTAIFNEETGELSIVRLGGIATAFDEEKGELDILNNAATYNEATGELTI